MQHECFEKTGEFTPPVLTIYATIQALKEYFEVGEEAKFARHRAVFKAIKEGVAGLGLKEVIKDEIQSGLVVSVLYPDDPQWSFEKVHDYCYERGFTIYPVKISTTNTFRLCSLGTITPSDIARFIPILKEAIISCGLSIPLN